MEGIFREKKERMFHILRQCNTMINEMDGSPDIDQWSC